MNVLHIYRTYFPDPPGGLQEAIRQICEGCNALGINSTVFTLSPQPNPAVLERPEGRVVRARSWWAPASCDLGLAQSVASFTQEARKADVLHFHFPWPFADLLNLLPVARNKPKLITYHSDIVRQQGLAQLYAPLMNHTLRDMDAVVATSDTYARTSKVLSDPKIKDRVSVIPLGLNAPELTDQPPTGIFQRLGLHDEQPYVLALGVLRYYKGLHTLVNAAQNTKAHIVIAGSGPEEGNLKQLVQTLGLTNVVFAGQVSNAEKLELLRGCTALALPSHLRSEAYGMVLLEAAMNGKPMISCEIGTGTSFVNQHDETGFVVPPEDPVALASAINGLVNNPALAQHFGHQARERHERCFTADTMARSYAELYAKIAPQSV